MTSFPRILLILGVLLLILTAVFMYSPDQTGEVVEIPAPTPASNPGWETFSDDSLTFQYPAQVSTTYISAVQWPPSATVTQGQMSCELNVQIQDRSYCRTTQSEGAAGSVYTDYTYSSQREGGYVSLTFALRMTQCANYDDPQKTECEQERASFNPDALADEILQTVELK